MANDKLNMMTSIPHATANFADDSTDVYVEQAEAGADVCNVVFCGGMQVSTVTFLDAAALDELATFFAEAATKLRYCSRD